MHSVLYYINVGAAFFLLIGMALILARLLSGPTLYDRILAVNSFGTKTVLFLCVFSLIIGRNDGVDIAILYSLMNFIATVAVLKFFRYRALDINLSKAHIDKPMQPASSENKASPKKQANKGRKPAKAKGGV